MGDKRVVDYFKNYRDKYDLEHLKKKVLSMGYGPGDISDALVELGKGDVGEKSEEPKKDILKVKGASTQSLDASGAGFVPGKAVSGKSAVSARLVQSVQPDVNNVVASGSAVPLDAISTPYDPKEDSVMKTKSSAWFTIAGVSGLLGFLLLIAAGFLEGVVNQSLMLGSLFLFLIYFTGFILLGKRHNKKLISVVSWIFVILMFLSMILVVTLMVKPDFEFVSTAGISGATSFNEFLDAVKAFGVKWLVVMGSTIGVLFILGILFGAGFLKLKKDVKLAKVTGVLFLVGTITTLIGIGFLILFVSFVLSVVVLSKEK